MRLLKAGHVLYRDRAPEVHMHNRNTLSQWWKMGHRYGFWRTKVLLKHLAVQPPGIPPAVRFAVNGRILFASVSRDGGCFRPLYGVALWWPPGSGLAGRWLVRSCWCTVVFGHAAQQFYAGFGRRVVPSRSVANGPWLNTTSQ